MLSDLKKISPLITLAPLVALVAYISGFVSFTTYLLSYGITETPSLDLKVLKFGTLYCVLTLPVVYFGLMQSKKTERNQRAKKMMISLGLAYSYIFLIGYIMQGSTYKLNSLTLLAVILSFVLGKIDKQSKVLDIIRLLWYFTPFVVGFLHYRYQFVDSHGIELFEYQLSVFCAISFISLGLSGEKELKGISIMATIGILLYSMSHAGYKFIPRIWSNMGGEQAFQVKIYFSEEFMKSNECTPIRKIITNGETVVPVIYMTNENFYVLNQEEVACIPKSAIIYYAHFARYPGVEDPNY